jgi:hypothetical protein
MVRSAEVSRVNAVESRRAHVAARRVRRPEAAHELTGSSTRLGQPFAQPSAWLPATDLGVKITPVLCQGAFNAAVGMLDR